MLRISGRRQARVGTWSAILLASTMLTGVGVAPAMAADKPAADPPGSPATVVGELVVTAQKREENIQRVPMSIQAIGNEKAQQLNITEFQDYVKFMPSATFQMTGEGPGSAQVYMRGVTSGANGNHSGSLPTVGTYLDEMPVTTIGGTLDVHIYDIARIEVLPGPQGTLYGASSEAGTLRILTNKPSTAGFSAGYDAQVNQVDHGGTGYNLEGFVNIPAASNVAVRLVGWDEYDAGFIDNVPGTRTFPTSGTTINNNAFVKKDFNDVHTIGGRAALKWDVNDSWTIEPSIMGQEQRTNGVFGYQPDVGFLQVQRFQPDTSKDTWGAAALSILGKIGKYDLTYAGGYFQRHIDAKNDYTDYSIFYDKAYGSGAYWQDSAGKPLSNPDQEIFGKDRFEKTSHELRIASPSGDRFRFIAGLFGQRQTHWVDQSYQIPGLAPALSVPNNPNTIWLTDEMRIDRDAAIFGEASFDVTEKLTLTAGIRGYWYKNSLEGFYGFSANYDALAGFKTGMGVNNVNCLSMASYRGGPCINLNKTVSDTGETHKINATYKFDPDRLVYFTYSTGFRPGGVNRNGNLGPYQADTLDNYEIGWKTAWLDGALRVNGALYWETWNQFQYSFLGPNLLTAIENGPEADVLGLELSADWRPIDQLTLSFNGAYNDAKMKGPLCKVNTTPCPANSIQAPDGQRLPYTPKFKGNLTARYTFPILDWDGHAQAALVYQTEEQIGLRTVDVTTFGSIPAYGTADFAVGAVRQGLSLELFIKNAFDANDPLTRFVSCGSICAKTFPGIPRGFYVVPVQPRTIGFRIGQRF
jgi:iron complex outermembrane receptor protein